MKVVLFCGGLGTRLKEYSGTIPKPMVPLGQRPIIWHIMRYYAHFGHKDFVLCLGHGGNVIKDYFLNHSDPSPNDFTLLGGERLVRRFRREDGDWTIALVDTGAESIIGERLVAVRELVENDDMFLANYSDGLTDLDLRCQVARFRKNDAIGSVLLVRPTNHSFHFARVNGRQLMTEIVSMDKTDLWINGGFFIFRREIFDYIQKGEELVEQPFERLVEKRGLIGHRHPGFWCSMDTYKDKKLLDDLHARGDRPWEVWQRSRNAE